MATTHIAYRNDVGHKFTSYAEAARFVEIRANANELWKIALLADVMAAKSRVVAGG